MPVCRSGRWAVLLVALSLCASRASRAQTVDPAAESDRLFYEGNELMTQGHVAEACAKFEQSLGLQRRGGTLMNLAVCRKTAGELVAALPLFEEALAAALRDGRAERAQEIREHIADLRTKLSWITVTPAAAVTAASPELEIRIDGAVVPRAQWSLPVAVAPGPHVVTATAPGKRGFEARVAGAKAGETHPIAIGEMQPVVLETPVVNEPPAAVSKPVEGASPPPPPREENLSHEWQLGLMARLDVDPIHPGARLALGPTLGLLGDHFEVGASVLLGRDIGIEPQVTFYFLGRTPYKPFLNAGMPIFFAADGGHIGVRGAAGFAWDLNTHLGVFGQIGGAYFPGAPAGVAKGVLLPAFGLQGRL